MTLLKGLAAGRKICKLKKSIYGLGQVPSMWPQHLREHKSMLNFRPVACIVRVYERVTNI
jgi:hypothetical protein